MPGDYISFQMINSRRTTDIDLAAGDATKAGIVTPSTANHKLYIQLIVFVPSTYSAKTLTFRDSAASPVPIGLISIPAAAPTTGGDVGFRLDFGPTGVALTTGKNLDIILSGAGAAGRIHVEAYEKLGQTISA